MPVTPCHPLPVNVAVGHGASAFLGFLNKEGNPSCFSRLWVCAVFWLTIAGGGVGGQAAAAGGAVGHSSGGREVTTSCAALNRAGGNPWG